MRMKTFVNQKTDGITNKCQPPGPRVARVTACALALAGRAQITLDLLKETDPYCSTYKVHMKGLSEDVSLLNRGLQHEIDILHIAEEDTWTQTKYFEGHERYDSEVRKRNDHAKILRKADEKGKGANAPKKPAGAGKGQNQGQRPTTRASAGKTPDSGTPMSKQKCFNCREYGHHAKDCKNPKRVES